MSCYSMVAGAVGATVMSYTPALLRQLVKVSYWRLRLRDGYGINVWLFTPWHTATSV